MKKNIHDNIPSDFDAEKGSDLFGTIQTISAVMQTKKPSEDFTARLTQAVQDRFQKRMAADRMRRVIGMAATDADFRKSLFSDVVAACRNIGFELTPREIAALRSLKEDAVEEFANSLDERITKFFPTSLP